MSKLFALIFYKQIIDMFSGTKWLWKLVRNLRSKKSLLLIFCRIQSAIKFWKTSRNYSDKMTITFLCTVKWVRDRSNLSLTFDLDPLFLFWFLKLEEQVQVCNLSKTRKSTKNIAIKFWLRLKKNGSASYSFRYANLTSKSSILNFDLWRRVKKEFILIMNQMTVIKSTG